MIKKNFVKQEFRLRSVKFSIETLMEDFKPVVLRTEFQF